MDDGSKMKKSSRFDFEDMITSWLLPPLILLIYGVVVICIFAIPVCIRFLSDSFTSISDKLISLLCEFVIKIGYVPLFTTIIIALVTAIIVLWKRSEEKAGEKKKSTWDRIDDSPLFWFVFFGTYLYCFVFSYCYYLLVANFGCYPLLVIITISLTFFNNKQLKGESNGMEKEIN